MEIKGPQFSISRITEATELIWKLKTANVHYENLLTSIIRTSWLMESQEVLFEIKQIVFSRNWFCVFSNIVFVSVF
jgi:hypothetical protein